MDKTGNKTGVIVGIFLALGLLILLGVVFTLGGSEKRFVKSTKITAIFDDVQGLKTGNNVWFSGVKIGTVKKIDFYGTNDVKITMNIENEAQKYIRKNAKAKVSSEGLIGNRIIVIYGGSTNFAPVEDNDNLAVEHALSTDEVMETLQENNKNLVDITRDFKLLSMNIRKGKGTIGAVLTDSLLADQVKGIIYNLDVTSRNTIKITSQVNAAMNTLSEKLNTKGGLLDKMLTDTTVFSQLKTASARLNQLTLSAGDITANLKKTTERLNSSDNALNVLTNDKDAAQKIKSTIGNLDAASKKLDEDLEALQHNFLLKGFFKNKKP